MKHKGPRNQGNDHEPGKLLIFKQILLVSDSGNEKRIATESAAKAHDVSIIHDCNF